MVPDFWKPLTADYVAAGVFFSPEKWPPYFWKPLTCGYVAAGVFFFSEKWAPGFWKPLTWVRSGSLKKECGALFFWGKNSLEQRTHKLGASRNMGAIFQPPLTPKSAMEGPKISKKVTSSGWPRHGTDTPTRRFMTRHDTELFDTKGIDTA